ncbi:hypothetical protein ACWDNU_45725, partial [Amycolatopsis sp. NPDC003676]
MQSLQCLRDRRIVDMAESPMDLQSLDKWDDYTAAKEAMFLRTDNDLAP